jgi:hypothetical protein
MKLCGNAFSPSARKGRLMMDWKRLAYQAVEGSTTLMRSCWP